MAGKRRETAEERSAREAADKAADAEFKRQLDFERACETYGPPLPPEMEKALWRAQTDKNLEWQLRTIKEKLDKTHNPLYIFEAITACQRHAMSIQETAEAAVTAAPSPFPEWVNRYLGVVARDIGRLAYGRDFRAVPIDADLDSPAGRAAWRAWRAGTLDPQEAMRLVPAALYLARPGWSAFNAFQAEKYDEYVAEEFQYQRELGKTADEAAADIAEREGYADGRSVFRVAQRQRRKNGDQTS